MYWVSTDAETSHHKRHCCEANPVEIVWIKSPSWSYWHACSQFKVASPGFWCTSSFNKVPCSPTTVDQTYGRSCVSVLGHFLVAVCTTNVAKWQWVRIYSPILSRNWSHCGWHFHWCMENQDLKTVFYVTFKKQNSNKCGHWEEKKGLISFFISRHLS